MLEEKSILLPVSPPQISHELALGRSGASSVRG